MKLKARQVKDPQQLDVVDLCEVDAGLVCIVNSRPKPQIRFSRAAERAQRLRTLVEDLSSGPSSTHDVWVKLPVTPTLGDLMPCSGLCQYLHFVHIYIIKNEIFKEYSIFHISV